MCMHEHKTSFSAFFEQRDDYATTRKKISWFICEYVSWGLVVGSFKLIVKTQGQLVPTLSARDFIEGKRHYESENLPI